MNRHYCAALLLLALGAATTQPAFAGTTEYSLTIERQPVNITGKEVRKITVNGTIPGPTLRFKEGDDAVINVINRMNEDTSIHWHGLLLPDGMDGVPGLGGFHGIKPGETFTYRFKVRQDGTYWYHAHSAGQEQDGSYGSIVITPTAADPVKTERDYVVLLSDYTDEESDSIMANLKMSSEYYQYARRTLGDFFADAREQGFGKAWANAKAWGEMRMLPTDLSDVTGYTFLINGKNPEQNWTGIFKPGERVRLRFINASAMSFYDVRIPGLKMTVVGSDGQNVEPVQVDEFRFGVAETYDVVVTPREDKAYTIAAEPVDRTGFALGTLAPREGMRGEAPSQRPRALLTMADMGMAHGGHDMASMDHGSAAQKKPKMDHAAMGHAMPEGHDTSQMDHGSMNDAAPQADHAAMGHNMSGSSQAVTDYKTGVDGSGWAQAGTPLGDKALSYEDLRYHGIQKDVRQPERVIEVRLGGNMERYIWTLNGKKYSETGPINLQYGERVRLRFVNETMMAHPMHLHGMFVQLENGQPAEKLPNKHTVIVAPGDTYSVLLTADEAGEWAFHCHLLYHMMAGMMNKVVVAKLDPTKVPNKPGSVSKPSVMPGMDHGKMGHPPATDGMKMDNDMDSHDMHKMHEKPAASPSSLKLDEQKGGQHDAH